MKTKVIFRTDKKTGEVIAWFPEIAGTQFYLQDCQTYQHLGQHGSGTFNYYYETTRPSTLTEATPLWTELESIGYELRLAFRLTYRDLLKRKSQVKGE